MRTAFLVAALLLLPATVRAQGPMGAPYQRTRTGAGDWQARGGHLQHWRGGGFGGYGAGFGGYINPLFVPPIVAGSWYERPYPYHFDYYRHRWGGAANDVPYGGTSAQMMPVADCPCLATPPADVVQ